MFISWDYNVSDIRPQICSSEDMMIEREFMKSLPDKRVSLHSINT